MSKREIKFRAWATSENGLGMFQWDEHKCEIAEWLGNEERGVIFMQFTGIKDKNGKEIYEGDIVRFAWGNKGWSENTEVVFNGGSFIFKHSSNVEIENYNSEKWGQIIGNIYENPELLKKGV